MKRRFTILTAALALLAFLAVPMGMMGQTRTAVTWTASEQGYTNGESLDGVSIELDDYITIQFDKNDGNNAPAYYNTGTAARLYPKNSLTVTPASGYQITGMTLTFSGTGNTGTLGASVGSYSLSSATGTWSGSSTSAVVLTNNATSGHARMQVLTVTYSEAGSTPPTPTTYTVTYDCNGGTTGCPENVTGIEAGEEITLADAPTKDGFDFAGWNDGNNTYDAGDEYNVNGNVTFTAQWTEVVSGDVHWVLTDLADLTANDVFVIVGNNGSNYAMTNNNGTGSAPATTAVTIAGNEITSTVIANIQWNVSGNSTDGYTFYPNGSTTTWLYCNTEAPTSSNNNMRVGTGNRKVFELNSNNYLMTKDDYVVRYLSIYNDADWRGYINTNLCPAMSFYKKVTGDILPPSITANNVSIAYDATSGEIAYTLNNPVTDGNLSISENVDWISNAVLNTTESKVTFNTTANETNTSREGIITITYTYGNNETVTKDVAVTQEAAPVIYTTIPALFDAATSTATDVNVTFGGWVVSAVKGSNAYLTDNQGHGLIIYASEHGFQVNDVLTGTVSCKLQTYKGSAELTNLTASTEGLTVAHNGTVTEANIAMANLAGVNTGALVSYENLVCSVTTSGDYTNYDLTDGTTTIRAYTTLYDFTSTPDLENGKTYNIKGIFLQYNTTKEIMPRSAEDIVEVEVQHEEYTLTVSNLSHVNLFIFGGEESETIISTEDGETTAQVYDGTEVLVSIDVEAGYVFQSLTITDGNGDPVNMEELTAYEYYSFVMPASNVTITATAEEYVAPTGETGTITFGNNGVKITSASASQDGQTALDDINNSWTITTAGTTSFSQSTNYSQVGKSAEPATSITFTTTLSESVTITSFEAKFGGFSNTAGDITLKVDEYTVGTGSLNGTADVTVSNTDQASGTTLTVTITNIAKGVKCYYISYTYETAQTPQTFTLDIAQYTPGQNNGWYLIASPVSVDIASNTMVSGTYDLYRYNPTAELEWENYEATENNQPLHSDFTTLEVGRGYLYANGNNNGIQLSFTGTPANNGEVTAAYTGWNLIGNPLSTAASVDKDYYRMNDTHTGIMTETGTGNVARMEGIFVNASAGETITFTPASKSSNRASVVMNLSQNRGDVIDRAIVRFGEGNQLPKFQLFENSTKIYFTEGNEDYAIVHSANEGEMPVSFKASENGTYTITVNTENVEANYLHLIDNMTGADVDLLTNSSYSFEARTTDYANRFKLVFATGNNSNDDNFAFFSNGSFVINNEGNATLQVVDVTGRLISSETINGCANVNVDAAPGVYMLRLVNGENVKMQKVVVR